jgi:hypothetical protein
MFQSPCTKNGKNHWQERITRARKYLGVAMFPRRLPGGTWSLSRKIGLNTAYIRVACVRTYLSSATPQPPRRYPIPVLQTPLFLRVRQALLRVHHLRGPSLRLSSLLSLDKIGMHTKGNKIAAHYDTLPSNSKRRRCRWQAPHLALCILQGLLSRLKPKTVPK